MDAIYLDYNATSPLNPKVCADPIAGLQKAAWANPSSLHSFGRKARRAVREASETLARAVGADSEFVFWTSGATESNSWAIWSAFELARSKGRTQPRLLIACTEHDSVLMAAKHLLRLGLPVSIDWIPVRPSGEIDLAQLEKLLASDEGTDLVSAHHANNETGVIQPIEQIRDLCARAGAPLHIDCAQSLGKIDVHLPTLGATWATFSAHKIGGPKGVGALIAQGEGKLLSPIVHGKQQKTLRGGTENAAGVAQFASALAILPELQARLESLRPFHQNFEKTLLERIPGTIIHGATAPRRLPNTSFVGFEGIEGDGLLMNLDMQGVAASSGSACTSGSLEPSHVLLAMGVSRDLARSSVRFSSGWGTTAGDFEAVLRILPEIIGRMRITQ